MKTGRRRDRPAPARARARAREAARARARARRTSLLLPGPRTTPSSPRSRSDAASKAAASGAAEHHRRAGVGGLRLVESGGARGVEVEILLHHLFEDGGVLDDLRGIDRLGLEDGLRLRHERQRGRRRRRRTTEGGAGGIDTGACAAVTGAGAMFQGRSEALNMTVEVDAPGSVELVRLGFGGRRREQRRRFLLAHRREARPASRAPSTGTGARRDRPLRSRTARPR